MDIHHHIAQRLRELRSAQGYSLDALAERSGVSRSNISLIERGESSPTAAVLDKLAIGLGVALASFFDESADGSAAHEGAAAPSPHIRAADQPRWQDAPRHALQRDHSRDRGEGEGLPVREEGPGSIRRQGLSEVNRAR